MAITTGGRREGHGSKSHHENRADPADARPDADPHTLIFHLRDGREEKLEWQNRSRAESWTPEMKEKAREKARRKNDGKNSN